MTIYLIHIDRRAHTCPADPDPHPYDTHRTVLALTHGGPCHTPQTIRCGDTTATVACGRQLPADQQCPACRTTVVEHTITDHHDGPHRPAHQTAAPAGHADHPCQSCGQPLAAALAHIGRHLLCQPQAQSSKAAA